MGNLIAGPNLIFQVLPALFESMGTSGLLIAFIFFLLMSIAAITSSISMLEVPVSYVVEEFKVRRRSATYFISAIIFSISVIICLNFESLFSFVITLTTERAQPLLGALICIFAGWVFSRNKILAEIKNGNDNAEHGYLLENMAKLRKICLPCSHTHYLHSNYLNVLNIQDRLILF